MSVHSCWLVVGMACAAVIASATEPVVGTWKLNVAKSTYRPGPAPKGETRIYEAASEGIKVTVKTLEPDGRAVTIHVSANYDGKDYPVNGGGEISAIALKKVDEYKAESTLMHGSIPVATAVREVSKDGKTMTIMYKGTDRHGQSVNNKAVYDRE